MADFFGFIFGLFILYLIGYGAYHGAHALGYAWYNPETYSFVITSYLTVFIGSILGIFTTIFLPPWLKEFSEKNRHKRSAQKRLKMEEAEQKRKHETIQATLESGEKAKKEAVQKSDFEKLSMATQAMHEASLRIPKATDEKKDAEIVYMSDLITDIIKDDLLKSLKYASGDQFEDMKFLIEDIWENLGFEYQNDSFGRRFKRLILPKIESGLDETA